MSSTTMPTASSCALGVSTMHTSMRRRSPAVLNESDTGRGSPGPGLGLCAAAQALRLPFQQRGRGQAAEPPALTREVCLVGVAGRRREPGQVDPPPGRGPRGAEEVLETDDPRERARRVAHRTLDAPAELALAERDVVCQATQGLSGPFGQPGRQPRPDRVDGGGVVEAGPDGADEA